MQIDYRRDIHHNYLILSGEHPPDTASYQVRMLMTNKINEFLSCNVHQIDQNMLFYYDITSKQPLNVLVEHQQIKKDILELLFSQIVMAMESAQNYLLKMDGILLKPELIYADAVKKQLWFCYYPGNPEPFQEQLKELSEYLLPRLAHQDKDAVMMGYAFYQKCMEETVTAEVFMELLHRVCVVRPEPEEEVYLKNQVLGASGEVNPDKQNEGIPENREQLLEAFFEPEERVEKFLWDRKKKWIAIALVAGLTGILVGFGLAGLWVEGCLLTAATAGICLVCWVVRKSVLEGKEREEEMEKYIQANWLSGDEQIGTENCQRKEEELEEETVFLGMGNSVKEEGKAWLIPEGGYVGEHIKLEQEVHLVGKGKTTADIQLPSSAVSRVHARLIWEAESYSILDLNSRNGTYINEKLLPAGETYLLESGDKIRFADLTYCFQK